MAPPWSMYTYDPHVCYDLIVINVYTWPLDYTLITILIHIHMYELWFGHDFIMIRTCMWFWVMTWVHLSQCIYVNWLLWWFLTHTRTWNLEHICYVSILIHMHVQSHPQIWNATFKSFSTYMHLGSPAQLWNAMPAPGLMFMHMLSHTLLRDAFVGLILTHMFIWSTPSVDKPDLTNAPK